MRSLLGSLLRNRRLLKDFVVRDLKARYVGSSMGFFWSVVFPVINLFVYMFVFRLVLNARWSDRQGPAEVALVMLAGIVVWGGFAETVSRSTNTLVDNSNLIQKVVFPAEILPCYLTVSSLINMCIGLPVVLGCVAWFAFSSPPDVFLKAPGELVPRAEGKDEWVATDVRLGEGHDPYGVHLELTRGTHRRVHVPFTLSGTAVEGEDYLLDAREAVIARGDPRVTLLFTPLRDGVDEGEETIVIELGEPAGARLLHNGTWAAKRLEFLLVDGRAPEIGDPPPPLDAPAFRYPPPPDPLKDPMSVYYPLDLGVSLLALPLLFALQVVFTVGLGYFLATLNLFLRDTYHLVGVGITVWMFGTPIFYPAGLVQKAGFGWMLELNPMHWLIDSYRSVLLFGRFPELLQLGKFALVAGLVFFLGGAFFMSHKSKFPDLL